MVTTGARSTGSWPSSPIGWRPAEARARPAPRPCAWSWSGSASRPRASSPRPTAPPQAIREDAANEVRQQLVDANLTAESLRGEASEYAGDTRDEADAYARKVRAEADSYAEGARGEADAELEVIRAGARKEAERIVADAQRRKADIEELISDLEQRRDAVIAELDRLASGIAGTATEHRTPARAERGPGDEDERATDDTDETTLLASDTK